MLGARNVLEFGLFFSDFGICTDFRYLIQFEIQNVLKYEKRILTESFVLEHFKFHTRDA